jgi:exopolysaccharide production protein ExoQ
MKLSHNKLLIWWIFILLLPYMSSYLSIINENVYRITVICRVISFIIVCGLYIFRKNRKLPSISKFTILPFLYMGILLLSTVINNGDIAKYLGYFITCIGLLLLIELYSKVGPDSLMAALVYIFRFMVYINFILLILYPNGVYTVSDIYSSAVTRYNFLGLDNQTGPYFILLMSLSLCRQFSKGNRIDLLCKMDILVCTISTIYLWSATAIVGFFVFYLFYLLALKYNIVNLRASYKVIGVIFVIVVLFQGTTLLKPIFEGLLNKDVTLTGRTYIWKEAISMIFKNPLLGYGIQESPNLVYFFVYQDYRTAHNEYLQILINGGIGCIVLLLAQLSKVKQVINKPKNRNRSSMILSAGIVALLVMMLTESYGQMLCFYVMIFYSYFRYSNIAFES